MMSAMDRAQRDWLHYKNEAALAARLDDAGRVAQMRDLFEAYLAFQRSKSPAQILRELRTEWRLDRGRMSPRYLGLREAANRDEANRAEADGHDEPR